MGHKPDITPKKKARYKALAAERAAEEQAASGMSDRAAEERARELWGNHAAAWHHHLAKRGDLRFCQVGLAVGETRDNWKVFGRGADWETAFKNAKEMGYC